MNYYAARRPPVYPEYLPPSQIRLRDYQEQMIADINDRHSEGHKRILVSAPPGAGKTSIMAALARQAYNRGQRTTILVPFNCVVTKSEIEPTQMCGALIRAGLGGKFGVFSGAFPGLQNAIAPIQVVTLQSLEPLHNWLNDSHQILIDEGHTGAFFAQAEKAYQSWSWELIVNFTATPFNRSMGRDDRYGELQRNTAIVTAPPYRALQKDGYLSPLRYHGVSRELPEGTKLDLTSDNAVRWMLEQWVSRCRDLRLPLSHAIGFCKAKSKGVSQMEAIQRIGLQMGIHFAIVGDGVKQDEYEAAMRLFEAGQANLLCVQALSTGWDCDLARHALLFRPIASRDRCVQAATRVDRPHPSKTFGEIWDFCGNFQLAGEDSGLHPIVEDLSEAIDVSVLQPKEKTEGQAPFKYCVKDGCKKQIHAAAVQCPHCHTPQPLNDLKFELPNGQLVSFVPESVATKDRAGAIAYFRQWRKIAYAKGWNPFSAHRKCLDLGIEVKMSDRDFWKGSIGVTDSAYEFHLKCHAKYWNWDAAKIARELAREFGR